MSSITTSSFNRNRSHINGSTNNFNRNRSHINSSIKNFNRNRPHINVFSNNLMYITHIPTGLNWRGFKHDCNRNDVGVLFIETFSHWDPPTQNQVLIECTDRSGLENISDAIDRGEFPARNVRYYILKGPNHRRLFFERIKNDTGADLLSFNGIPPQKETVQRRYKGLIRKNKRGEKLSYPISDIRPKRRSIETNSSTNDSLSPPRTPSPKKTDNQHIINSETPLLPAAYLRNNDNIKRKNVSSDDLNDYEYDEFVLEEEQDKENDFVN